MSNTSKSIPYVPEGTLDPAAGLNLSLKVINTLVQPAVISVITALPGSPTDGAAYLVAASGTSGGAIGHENQIAYYVGGWNYLTPGFGWEVIVLADGTRRRFTDLATDAWLILTSQVSANNGNAAATLTPRQNPFTQIWGTALTADRAVTLSTTGAMNGDKFRIVRKAAATGAFNLNVGTGPLKALATAGTWCEVEYDGSAWFLSAYGSL